jgi:hypothetical protein
MAVTATIADNIYRSGTTSIASVPIGTAAAGRIVVAFARAENANSSLLYPATIAGVTAVRQDLMSTAALVATGTTATIAVSGASLLETFGVYALSGSANPRPAVSAYTNNFATSGTRTLAVPVSAGSTVLALATDTTFGASLSLSGVTTDASFTDGGGQAWACGHADQASAGTVTVTANNATDLWVYVFDTVGPDWLFVGSTSPVQVASGNLNLAGEPTGSQQDDILIAEIGTKSNATFTPPSGWANAATQQLSGDTTSTGPASAVLAYIIRGASAPASFTFTRTAGSTTVGRIHAFRHKNAGTPTYDVGSANTAASAATTITTPTVTAAAAGELVFATLISGSTTRPAPYSISAATTPKFVAQVDSDTVASGSAARISSGFGVTTASGATGTFTSTPAQSVRFTAMVALFGPPTGGTNANVSGASATAAAGSVSSTIDSTASIGGAAATAAAGTVTASSGTSATANPAGAQATAAAGSIAANVSDSGSPAGAAASALAGSLAEQLGVSILGAAATAAAGSLADQVNPAPSGAAVTAAAGSVAASQGAAPNIAGAAANAQAGSVAQTIAPSATGAAVTAAAGLVSPAISDSSAVSGAFVTGQAGSVSITSGSGSTVNVSGAAVVASAGTVAPSVTDQVSLSGAAAAAIAGLVAASLLSPPSGAAAAALPGAVSIQSGTSASANLAGASATARAGGVAVQYSSSSPIGGAFVQALAGNVTASITGIVLNPNYIATGRPRRFIAAAGDWRLIAAGRPRHRIVVGISNQMSQTNTLQPPIDAAVEIETATFDYGLMLAPGATIVGTPTITCTVVSGADASPGSRLVNSAQIITSPNSGVASQAVAQLVGNMVGGVTYKLQCVASISDGQVLSLWTHLSCVTPK